MAWRVAGWAGMTALAVSPAFAAARIAIPEPSDPWLFGLGVAGLLVGRHAARRRAPRE